MKKAMTVFLTAILLCALSPLAAAAGIRLVYKLAPGQQWTCSLDSKNETSYMGQKSVTQSRSVYSYTVSEGPKSGWVRVTAVIGNSGAEEGGMDLSKLVFTADVHSSGEIRNIEYSGDVMPDLGPDAADMPESMIKMMQASYKMIPEAYKNSVFWFPEVPEDPLQVGEEFDVKRKMSMGGGAPVQTEAVTMQTFTLDDVSEGLAYFSVRQRSVVKTGGALGGETESKVAGKGEAVFDLEQGMWLELTEKSRAKVDMGGIPGMGDQPQNVDTVSKYEMERE